MIYGLLLSVIIISPAVVAAERKIQCGDGADDVQMRPGERIRFTSTLYPDALVDRSKETPACRKSFSANGRMKLSFVNGFMGIIAKHTFLPIRLEGVEPYPNNSLTLAKLDTGAAFGPNYSNLTNFASNNLVVRIDGEKSFLWRGFEAVLELVEGSSEKACTREILIDLRDAEGPVAFGTMPEYDLKLADGNCSWVITSDGAKTIKVVIRAANLRVGESLVFTDSKQTRTLVESTKTVYYFPNEMRLTLEYHRKANDFLPFGFSAQASAFVATAVSSRHCSPRSSSIVLGGKRPNTLMDFTLYSSLALDSVVIYRNRNRNFTRPYRNNMKCHWQLKIQHDHELQIKAERIHIEECCDKLTMAPRNMPETVLSQRSLQEFRFEKNVVRRINFTWVTDGDVRLWGFVVNVNAVRCSCFGIYVDLLQHKPYKTIFYNVKFEISRKSSASAPSYCNNMNCSHEVNAPAGYLLVVEISGEIRPVDGDAIELRDDISELWSISGASGQQLQPFSARRTSPIGFANVIFTSGFSSQLSLRGSWKANFCAFRALDQVTHLTEDNPTAYKLYDEFVTWTITAPNQVELYVRSDEFAFRSFATVHDGNASGPVLDNRFMPITSKSGQLTIVRKTLENAKDTPVLFVKDSRQLGVCSPSPVVMRSFELKVKETVSTCAMTVFPLKRRRVLHGMSSFIIVDMSRTTYNGKEPIRLIAGTFTNSTVDKQELMQISSDTPKAGRFEFPQRVITLIIPAGASFSMRIWRQEYSAFKLKRTVPLGETGYISSHDYWQPNNRYTFVTHYEYSVDTIAAITLEISMDLHPNSRLFVSSPCHGHIEKFKGTKFKQANFSFNCTGFAMTYTPRINGERGFRAKYTFESTTLGGDELARQLESGNTKRTTLRRRKRKKSSSGLPTTAGGHPSHYAISLAVYLAQRIFGYS